MVCKQLRKAVGRSEWFQNFYKVLLKSGSPPPVYLQICALVCLQTDVSKKMTECSASKRSFIALVSEWSGEER
jgi:hypothetical protein